MLHVQAELHSANARVQELLARLQDAKNRGDPNREQLLEQVHNLQNLLSSMRAPAVGSSNEGAPVDGLLAGMDIGRENAMHAGAEKMCLQKTKEAELVAVRIFVSPSTDLTDRLFRYRCRLLVVSRCLLWAVLVIFQSISVDIDKMYYFVCSLPTSRPNY